MLCDDIVVWEGVVCVVEGGSEDGSCEDSCCRTGPDGASGLASFEVDVVVELVVELEVELGVITG